MTLSDARKRYEAGESLVLVCTICGHTSSDVHFELEYLRLICNDTVACKERVDQAHVGMFDPNILLHPCIELQVSDAEPMVMECLKRHEFCKRTCFEGGSSCGDYLETVETPSIRRCYERIELGEVVRSKQTIKSPPKPGPSLPPPGPEEVIDKDAGFPGAQ